MYFYVSTTKHNKFLMTREHSQQMSSFDLSSHTKQRGELPTSMPKGVGYSWAVHGNFAMQIRLLGLITTSIYGKNGQLSGQFITYKYEKCGQLSEQWGELPISFPWELCNDNKSAHYFRILKEWTAELAAEWAAHWNLAMQIRLPATSVYGNSGQRSWLPMGCPWEFRHI